MRTMLWPVILFLLLTACEKRDVTPGSEETRAASAAGLYGSVITPPAVSKPSSAIIPLLQQASAPILVETAAEALPAWRRSAPLRPTLVLLSNYPFLDPVPAELQQEAVELVRKGEEKRLHQAVDVQRPDPLILPGMAIDAALRAGIFSRVIWVLPLDHSDQVFSAEIFRQQMLEIGALDAAEAATVSFADGLFSATVRGLPYQAGPLAALPAISGPIVLHVDLSYFQPLYKGEIKTGLYALVQETCLALRRQQWPAAAVTVSHANLAGGLPLETRFLGGDLAAIFAAPEFLDAPMPAAWDRRGQILYLENFFQKELIHDLYRQMEQADPQDASVKFGLYSLHRQLKDGDQALHYLAQAVALDPLYALEYLALAQTAEEKGLPEKKVQMLEKAAAGLPENPFLQLELFTALQSDNDEKRTEGLRQTLRRQPWSRVYYQDISELLGM